ncbi:MAG: glycosyltransferase family 39 protein [Clostridium sp.]|nr:glycosyltransferase family 39 protein [Clostridium sp.]
MNNSRNTTATSVVLLLMMAALFIYYAAVTLFNTKGEPREALVAVSMLQSGDWILPVSFGGDIPYKPPFMAWCIAALSWLFGGEVTELTSRLPSLLSAAILVVSTCVFFSRRSADSVIGFMTAFITMTSVEVFRNAAACRVDMMLTMFVVTALYALYEWVSGGCRGIPWLAVLLMSGGTLTKGPVGIALPCLVAGIYLVMSGERHKLLALLKLVVAALLACVLPALWYAAAIWKGDDMFLSLMLEENFGRFTGTMSYDSHVNPFYYNFLTLLAGMAPYTLLALMSLLAIRSRRRSGHVASVSGRRRFSDVGRYALTAAIVILLFYCIPKSKRSVYLLPMYPFISYFVAQLVFWLGSRVGGGKGGVLRGFTVVMGCVGVLIAAAYGALVSGLLDNVESVARFGFAQTTTEIVVFSSIALLTALFGVYAMFSPARFDELTKRMMATIFMSYVLVNTAVLPTVLSAKSDRWMARRIEKEVAAAPAEVYSYVSVPMLRFYTTGFYTSDGILQIDDPNKIARTIGSSGYLLVSADDLGRLESEGFLDGYRVEKRLEGKRKSCDTRRVAVFVRLVKKG